MQAINTPLQHDSSHQSRSSVVPHNTEAMPKIPHRPARKNPTTVLLCTRAPALICELTPGALVLLDTSSVTVWVTASPVPDTSCASDAGAAVLTPSPAFSEFPLPALGRSAVDAVLLSPLVTVTVVGDTVADGSVLVGSVPVWPVSVVLELKVTIVLPVPGSRAEL